MSFSNVRMYNCNCSLSVLLTTSTVDIWTRRSRREYIKIVFDYLCALREEKMQCRLTINRCFRGIRFPKSVSFFPVLFRAHHSSLRRQLLVERWNAYGVLTSGFRYLAGQSSTWHRFALEIESPWHRCARRTNCFSQYRLVELSRVSNTNSFFTQRDTLNINVDR